MRIFHLLTISTLFFLTGMGCANLRDEPLHMFRNDPAHSGKYESDPILEEPSVVWTFKATGRIYGSPIISQNRLYIGDGSGSLYALDIESGEKIWQYKAGGKIHSTPLVYRRNIYFMCSDGLFYAINSVSGERSWVFKTAGEGRFAAPGIHGLTPRDSIMTDDWDIFLSSPAAHNEKVFFGTGSGFVYALNASDGSEIWNFRSGDVVHSSPAVAHGKVYIGSWDRHLYALNEHTGEKEWSFITNPDTVNYNQTGIQSSPVIDGNMVYFGCRDSYVYGLDAFSGKLILKVFNDHSWVITTPLVEDKKLIFATSDTQLFRVVHAVSGEEIYELPLEGFIFSSPVITGKIVYIGSFNGTVYAIDTDSREVVWNFAGEAARKDPLDILNDDLSLDFDRIFEEPTKKGMEDAMGKLMSVGPVLSTPTLFQGRIFFATADGTVYALK